VLRRTGRFRTLLTRKDHIRHVEGFPTAGSVPYTVAALARFLGEVKSDSKPRDSFVAAFDALELMSEGYLTEAQIKGLEMWRFREVIRVAKANEESTIRQREERFRLRCRSRAMGRARYKQTAHQTRNLPRRTGTFLHG
jgi:hypothetical protein